MDEKTKELAQLAGFIVGVSANADSQIETLAALIRQDENEACANVAARIGDKYAFGYYGNEVDTADEIAAAIRARMK